MCRWADSGSSQRVLPIQCVEMFFFTNRKEKIATEQMFLVLQFSLDFVRDAL